MPTQEKFTETFEQFSSNLGTMDVLLYAGIALLLWYFTKDKMGGIKDLVMSYVNKLGVLVPSTPSNKVESAVSLTQPTNNEVKSKEDTFFKLVSTWKQLRNLAVEANCAEAVKAVDQMFPYLSPVSCKVEEGETK